MEEQESLLIKKKQRKDLVLECFGSIHKGATEMMKHIPDIFKSDIDVVLLLISKYNADRPGLNMTLLQNVLQHLPILSRTLPKM